jgi:hypothetical protein
MAFRTAQPNFSKGEISPELLGRFDVAAYNAGLRRARNVQILKYGGVTKRPGTRFVAEVFDATKPVRLVPFQFSLDQTYALEFGQGYMRPAAGGGMVLEEELAITGATQANPVQISAANHAYAAGDQVFLSGIAGMTELNGRTFTGPTSPPSPGRQGVSPVQRRPTPSSRPSCHPSSSRPSRPRFTAAAATTGTITTCIRATDGRCTAIPRGLAL